MTYACLILPYPPTSNHLFVHNPKTRRRFPSEKYVEWKSEAQLALIEQAPLPTFDGPVRVTLSLGRPDKRRRDLGNCEKAPVDMLVTYGVLKDDSLIERLTLQWDSEVTGCVVEIEAIDG